MSDYQLILGDCLEVMATMEAGSVDAVITDPPYGIGYTHGNQSAHGRSATQIEWSAIAGDDSVDGAWLNEATRILKDGGALYLVTRWDVEPLWRTEILNSGLLFKQRLTWHKGVNGKGDLQGTYQPTCEDVLFATKGRHLLMRRPSMLLDVGCVPTWEHRYHPHQKPIRLAKLLMTTSTQPGATVLDPFMGSGTTGVACIKMGRNFIGIEIDPTYFAIAQKRISEAAMQLPLLEIA